MTLIDIDCKQGDFVACPLVQTVNTATVLSFSLPFDAELQNEHTNQNAEVEDNLKNGDQKWKIKKQNSESRNQRIRNGKTEMSNHRF